MKIYPDCDKLQYTGRIDWTDLREPVFVFPCTSVKMRFTGKQLKMRVRNRKAYWGNYLGCVIDGEQSSIRLPEDGEAVLELPVKAAGELKDSVHEALIFKRQDSCHELTVLGFELEEGAQILDPPERPARRIEVYGDSVSAGEVSEAVEYTGRTDPEHNGEYSNSWYSYSWITARKLNAEIHDVAQGGIALLDNTGWFHAPDYIGMESAWDKIHYNPDLGPSTEWNFDNYRPQVVIVAIGQNDSHPDDYMKEEYDGARGIRWRSGYRAFLEKLRGKYPDVHIICITTLLEHDPAWDRAIDQVCREMADDKITHYMFRRNGKGTPGHLRIPEAEEMAVELSAYIESLSVDWE